MAQETKIIVRPDIGGREPAVVVERELALLNKTQGWELFETHYLGTEKKSGGHNVMFILVRDVKFDAPAQVGRPKKVE